MPDIQAALSQALTEWDADDQRPTHNPYPTTMTLPNPDDSSLSISERTFNFIKANPYISNKDAVEALVTQGLKENTVSSLIYQMMRAGMVSRDKDSRLTALRKKYMPLQIVRNPAASGKKPRAPYVARVNTDKVEGIAALNAPVTQPTLTTSKQMTAASVLETLSVKEARMLYLELHKMFAG